MARKKSSKGRIRRFFYVTNRRASRRHMMFSRAPTEGLTACGRVVSPGWAWSTADYGKPRCLECQRVVNAGTVLHVEPRRARSR